MIIVPGPVQIYVKSAECDATANGGYTITLSGWTRLGQTESGVNVSISNRAHRVNVDDMGGTQGAPADLIYLGSSASIRGTLVDYGDPNATTVSTATKKALYGIARGLRYVEADSAIDSTAFEGDISAPGTPLFEYGYGFALFLSGVGCTYLFPKCEFASNPREWNVSSLERRTTFTITAYEVPVRIGANASDGYDGRRLYYEHVTASGQEGSYTSCRTTIQGTIDDSNSGT